MTLTAGLLLALLSAAALNYGFYLQHKMSGTLPALTLRHPLSSLSLLFTNWKWLAGFATGLGGWALYIAALGLAPLALVQATSAGGVGLLALLVQRGGGSLTRPERVAVALSVSGLALLGLSLTAGVSRAPAPGWTAPLSWTLGSAVLALVAAVPGRPCSGPAPASRSRRDCCTRPATSRPRQRSDVSARCSCSPPWSPSVTAWRSRPCKWASSGGPPWLRPEYRACSPTSCRSSPA